MPAVRTVLEHFTDKKKIPCDSMPRLPPQISSTIYSTPCSLHPTHPYWTCSFRKNPAGSVPLPLGLPLFTDMTEEVGLEISGTGKCDFASAAVELSVFSCRYTPKEVQEGRSGSYVQTGLLVWSWVLRTQQCWRLTEVSRYSPSSTDMPRTISQTRMSRGNVTAGAPQDCMSYCPGHASFTWNFYPLTLRCAFSPWQA